MKKQTSVPFVPPIVLEEQKQRIAERLLAWYRAYKRDLPWRGGDAYAVWISEIMLQQTQVATVIPFFQRFLERFPTVEALASAPIDDVLQYWAGLGYYARARNLHRAAQRIVAEHRGRMPNTPEGIENLPGIGRYTSGAILSIAYNIPRPLVDANVVRVLSRVFSIHGDPKSTANQATLWSLAEQLVPATSPGDFNQGLMELGALICRPDEPLCEQCPLLPDCVAGNSSDPTSLPENPPGRATVTVTHSSALVLREGIVGVGKQVVENIEANVATYTYGEDEREDGASGTKSKIQNQKSKIPQVLIIQRPLHGLWGGLWEFPRVVCERGETSEEAAVRAAREVAGLDVAVEKRIGVVKHGVTHHKITLYGFLARPSLLEQSAVPAGCAAVRWVSWNALEAYAFSAPQALLRDALQNYFIHGASCDQQTSLDL